jgi:hypothetical protein
VALSGNLKELGPLELLQMIALQRKSGLLRAEARGRQVALEIRQGHIAAAHPAEGRFLRLLEALALLDPAQNERATLLAEESGDDLVEILLRAEGLDADALRAALALHAQAEVDHFLAADEGAFELVTDAPPSRTPIQTGLSLERAIHEGVRRLDEVANLRETRFSDGTIVEAIEDAPPPLPGPATYVRSLIAPGCAVADLLEASGLPPYETLTTLEEMVGAGLARASEQDRPRPRLEAVRPEGPGLEARLGALARVAAAIALALGVRFALAASLPPATAPGQGSFLTPAAEERREIAQLTLALELYRFEAGNYPLSLYYLVDRRLVSEPAVEDSEGRLYAYEIEQGGNAYILHRSMQGEPRLSYPFVERD